MSTAPNILGRVIDIFKPEQPAPLPLAWKLRHMPNASPDSIGQIEAAKKRLFKAYEVFQQEIEATVGEVEGLFRKDDSFIADRADLLLVGIEKSMEAHKNHAWQAWVGLDHGLEALRQFMGLIVDRNVQEVRHG